MPRRSPTRSRCDSNALYEHSYGFRNFFELQRYGINPAITWKPQQNIFVMLSYEHFRDWRTSDRGVPSIGMGSYFEGFPLRAPPDGRRSNADRASPGGYA